MFPVHGPPRHAVRRDTSRHPVTHRACWVRVDDREHGPSTRGRRAATRGRLPRRARRAQLLASALEVFVAQGYHAAAMDDIADRAGVSKPVLYQHFPGKLDLYLALLDQLLRHDHRQHPRARWSPPRTTSSGSRPRCTPSTTTSPATSGAFRLVFESDLTNEPAVRERVDRVTTECAGADRRRDPRRHRPPRRAVPAAGGLAWWEWRRSAPGSGSTERRRHRRRPRRPPWSRGWPGAASAATRAPTSRLTSSTARHQRPDGRRPHGGQDRRAERHPRARRGHRREPPTTSRSTSARRSPSGEC